MAHVKATVRNSLVSTVFPHGAEKRRETIEQMPSPARRSVALLLHELTVRHPRLAAKFLGIDYYLDESSDIEYINSGNRADVYRADNTSVMKIVRSSLWATAEKQKSIAANHNDGFTKLQDHVGAFTIPQSVAIEPHPLLTGTTAVVVRQPFINFQDPQLFRSEEGHSIKAQLDTLRSIEPQAAAQLPDFVIGSRRLYEKHGILPDTGGIGNLVLDTNTKSLVLIDGEPITPNFPNAQALILEHLDQLEAAL